jgi:hypothetical protein
VDIAHARDCLRATSDQMIIQEFRAVVPRKEMGRHFPEMLILQVFAPSDMLLLTLAAANPLLACPRAPVDRRP